MEIWRIEGKIKFALTELEKLNLNNAEDKSKKGNLIKVLSTMHEINKVNFEETRKNEQKVYSQPVFNIKVSKRKPSDMGQMGPKMTLGTLTMSGHDFPGVLGALRGSNSLHDLISHIYRRHSDTVYCSRQGGGENDRR